MILAMLVLASTAAAPTSAADITPVFKAAKVSEAPRWEGFYIGIHGGYAWGYDSSRGGNLVTGVLTNPPLPPRRPSGGVWGVQAGYTAVVGSSLLIGLEADWTAARVGEAILNSTAFGSISFATEAHWFGTVRPRVGAIFGAVALYATGGLAVGRFDFNRLQITGVTNGAGPGTFEVASATTYGWTIGGGVEYAVERHWSLKAEYLYYDFGKPYYQRVVSQVWAEHHPLAQVVRVAVNYRL
jgi:outer membrane immunogenic protein